MKLTFDIPDKQISNYECAQNVYLLMSCCNQTVYDVREIAKRIVAMAENNNVIQSNIDDIVAENSHWDQYPKLKRVIPSID